MNILHIVDTLRGYIKEYLKVTEYNEDVELHDDNTEIDNLLK